MVKPALTGAAGPLEFFDRWPRRAVGL